LVIRDGVTWAKPSFGSIHGEIAIAWKVKGKRLTLEVVVTAKTTAMVCVPTMIEKCVQQEN
jgi:hypothetical protein